MRKAKLRKQKSLRIKKSFPKEISVEEIQSQKKLDIKHPITLDKLDKLINKDYNRSLYWVNPHDIVGVDYQKIKANIRQDPNYYDDVEIVDDLGFYMTDLIITSYCDINDETVRQLRQDLPELLKKLSFIAKKLYSFSPSYCGVYATKELLTKENITQLVGVAQKEYRKANECEKIFLSVLYLNFFDIVLCTDVLYPDDEKCIDLKYFNEEQRVFLEMIKESGLKAQNRNNHFLIKNCKEY